MKKKITLATIKSFIYKNREKLYIKVNSRFDGMVDCVTNRAATDFNKAENDIRGYDPFTLGISGLWLVGHSGDHFDEYENDQFIGYAYSNSCGSGVVAIKKLG